MTDIRTLGKTLIYTEAPDAPDALNFVLPNVNPESDLPLDKVKFEPYVRLKALPDDIRRIVGTLVEATNIAEQIAALVPGLDRATPTYYPSGIAELQWKLDDSSVFGLILSNYSIRLISDQDGVKPEKSIKIAWRFHGPRQRSTSGEFKNLEEALDFVQKSFVTR